MNYPKFYIGQKVVAIDCSFGVPIVKNREYIVTGVYPGCCEWVVTVGIKSTTKISWCPKCKKEEPQTHEHLFNESRFAPIEEIQEFQAITFEKVLETELTSTN